MRQPSGARCGTREPLRGSTGVQWVRNRPYDAAGQGEPRGAAASSNAQQGEFRHVQCGRIAGSFDWASRSASTGTVMDANVKLRPLERETDQPRCGGLGGLLVRAAACDGWGGRRSGLGVRSRPQPTRAQGVCGPRPRAAGPCCRGAATSRSPLGLAQAGDDLARHKRVAQPRVDALDGPVRPGRAALDPGGPGPTHRPSNSPWRMSQASASASPSIRA